MIKKDITDRLGISYQTYFAWECGVKNYLNKNKSV